MADEVKAPAHIREWMEDAEFQQAILEEELINRVALRVLRVRRKRGLSQSELADAISTHQPAIARIESGEANITLRTLAQLSLALGCSPEDLVSEKSPDVILDGWSKARSGHRRVIEFRRPASTARAYEQGGSATMPTAGVKVG